MIIDTAPRPACTRSAASAATRRITPRTAPAAGSEAVRVEPSATSGNEPLATRCCNSAADALNVAPVKAPSRLSDSWTSPPIMATFRSLTWREPEGRRDSSPTDPVYRPPKRSAVAAEFVGPKRDLVNSRSTASGGFGQPLRRSETTHWFQSTSHESARGSENNMTRRRQALSASRCAGRGSVSCALPNTCSRLPDKTSTPGAVRSTARSRSHEHRRCTCASD